MCEYIPDRILQRKQTERLVIASFRSSRGRRDPDPGQQLLPLFSPLLLPFEISSRNRFAPLCETERDAVII